MNEPVHLHISRFDKNSNLFLLIFPTVVFFLTIFAYYIGFTYKTNQIKLAQNDQETYVLGENDTSLDIK